MEHSSISVHGVTSGKISVCDFELKFSCAFEVSTLNLASERASFHFRTDICHSLAP